MLEYNVGLCISRFDEFLNVKDVSKVYAYDSIFP
jgi:hypothetical protein